MTTSSGSEATVPANRQCILLVCFQGQGMRDAEMLVWAGDFNYRIEASYEDAIEHIRNNDLDYLVDRVSTAPLCHYPVQALQACQHVMLGVASYHTAVWSQGSSCRNCSLDCLVGVSVCDLGCHIRGSVRPTPQALLAQGFMQQPTSRSCTPKAVPSNAASGCL